MAKKADNKTLVIVESPAKARTISKFLGPRYTVEASIGHVRDLPEGKKEIPEKYKDESWAYLGVDVDHDFTPIYIVPPSKIETATNMSVRMKRSEFAATAEASVSKGL